MVLFLSFLIIVHPVKADIGYNFVDNYGFEDINSGGSAYIDLPVTGFQNFTDSGWTEFGDFPYIELFDNGTSRLSSSGESEQTINNFGFENLPSNVASVDNITLIHRCKSDESGARLAFYIATLDDYPVWYTVTDNFVGSYYVNVSFNIVSYTTTSKDNINSLLLKINRTTTGIYGGGGYIDAVCLHVGVQLSGSGQTVVTETSSPWYVDSIIGFDGEITTDDFYEGSVSYKSVNSEYIGITQYFPYGYYGDNITEVSLYAKSGANSQVKVGISYAGYYTLTNTQDLVGDSSWHKIEFELGYIIKSGRIIDGIEINVIGDTTATYIDNIVVNSTVSTDFKAFEWSITPTPKTVERESFVGYQNIEYHFTGYKYDFNGDLSENGTVSISSNYMTTQTEDVINGTFSFDISARTGIGDIEERLDITITTDSGVFTISIFGTYLGDTSVTPYNGEGEQEERSNNVIDWIIMFIVIFLPAILLASALYENNKQPDSMHIPPIFGLMAGLILSVGVGAYTGLLDLWILILMIVAVVILFVGMIRH